MTLTYAKLRGRIVEKFGTIRNYAKALGVHPLTVSRKLKGEVAFTNDDMLIWGELLEIEREDFGLFFFD